jgi:hypothetical protein
MQQLDYWNVILTMFLILVQNNSQSKVVCLKLNDKKFTIFNGNLNNLLNNSELFKKTLDNKLISKSVFIFHDIKWKNVCKAFLEIDIIISGRSSTKQHIISPLHLKLIFAIN